MVPDFESAIAKVHAAAAAGEDDQLFLAAEAGESLDMALGDPGTLTEMSKRFIEVAHQFGCTRIYGASALGQRLAGAAVALSRNGLKDQSAGFGGESVLVIDGLLVTGTQVAHAARAARLGGATSVCAAVVASVAPDTMLQTLTDRIEILER